MNLEALGNLGDFIAAIATLLTLVYLAIQIRQNTLAVQLASRRELSAEIQASFSPLYQPGYPRIWRLGLNEPEQLDQEERAVFNLLLDRLLYSLQTMVDQHQHMAMDPELFESTLLLFRTILSTPGGRRYWERNAPRFAPALRRHFETDAAAP